MEHPMSTAPDPPGTPPAPTLGALLRAVQIAEGEATLHAHRPVLAAHYGRLDPADWPGLDHLEAILQGEGMGLTYEALRGIRGRLVTRLGRPPGEVDALTLGEVCALLSEGPRPGEAPPGPSQGPARYEPPQAVRELMPHVDESDLKILKALAKARPRLLHLADIETEAGVSRRAAGDRVNQLITAGLVCRPRGERGGAGITPEGLNLVTSQSARGPTH
jgi:hypothetical protein